MASKHETKPRGRPSKPIPKLDNCRSAKAVFSAVKKLSCSERDGFRPDYSVMFRSSLDTREH